MKRLVAMLSVILTGVAAGDVHAGDTLSNARKKGVLVVGFRDHAPPFSYRATDSGRMVGCDIDFAAAITSRLGVKLESSALAPGNRMAALLDGKVDALALNVAKTPGRRPIIAVTDPYLVTGQKFLARRGTIKALRDLEGKRIGAVRGSPSERNVKAAVPTATVVALDGYPQGLQALQSGAVDAFTTDESILVDLLASIPSDGYEISPVRISEERHVFGVRRGDKSLLDFLNGGIRELDRNGEAGRIRDKWLPPGKKEERAAYGAIYRSAATPPRFLAVDLRGIFVPGAAVSIFTMEGDFVTNGTVVDVLEDQFYVDADRDKADLVQPGFLVLMNMAAKMARKIAFEHRKSLLAVKSASEEESKKLSKEAESEAISEAKRQQEIDMMEERAKLDMERERDSYYYGYGHY